MKYFVLFFIVLTACASAPPSQRITITPATQSVENIAVIPTNAIGLGYGNAEIVFEAISVCVFNILKGSDNYLLVERIDLDAVLNEHSLQNVSITSKEQLSALGQIYNAGLLLVSKAGIIGDSYYLSLKLLDVNTAAPIASVDETVSRTSDLETLVTYLVPRSCQLLCKDIGEYEGEVLKMSLFKKVFGL